jgi:hypothetical protein
MDIDDLYGAPLEQFIPERDALARLLRKEGKREDAAEVAGQRKPSVAAWAVNQLVRTQSRSIAELFAAGDALQEAHRTAASGRGDGATLRTASQRERAAVDALMEAARGLLTSDGHELSATIMDRVADTLRAAALDGDARAKVKDGRLQRELRHVGLGVIAPAGMPEEPATPGRGGAKRQGPKKESKKETKGATATDQVKRREQRAENERRKREQAQALKAAREAESKARRHAARADRAVTAAQERRERAAADLDSAEESLAAARTEAQAADDDRRRAQEQLERIDDSPRLGR